MGFGPEYIIQTTSSQESGQEADIAALEASVETLESTLLPITSLDDRYLKRLVSKTATGNLSAADVTSTVINNFGYGADTTLTLPAPEAGLVCQVILGSVGHAFYIKGDANHKIYLNGTAVAANGNKVGMATPSLFDCAAFEAVASGGTAGYDWVCTSIRGAWMDSGA